MLIEEYEIILHVTIQYEGNIFICVEKLIGGQRSLWLKTHKPMPYAVRDVIREGTLTQQRPCVNFVFNNRVY